LEELFHGVNFKEMFVLREFVGESSISFNENWSFSSSITSSEFSSEDFNGIKSIGVFLKLLDEELVSFTSGDIKLGKFVSNGDESLSNPF
jgi:hypothetical protein